MAIRERAISVARALEPSAVGQARADEEAAAAARARYRASGVCLLPPDAEIAALLAPGEGLIAVHRRVLVDRREGAPVEAGLAGDLYVTTRRLVFTGRRVVSLDLASISDGVVSGQSLLLVSEGGTGIRLAVGRPRLLWAQIVAARMGGERRMAGSEAHDQPDAR